VTTPFLGFLLLILPVSAPSSLERGDVEFARIRYPQAEAFYDSALDASIDSAEVLWRLARVYVCIADVSPRDQRLDLYRRAEAFAHRCIRADSTASEGHTWRAAALGNIAMFEGGRTKVELCYAIKTELMAAINLNPKDDIAYSILGSFYMALGNVSWVERQLAAIFLGSLPDGGYEESETALKKAIALAPMTIRHHFELGRLYLLQDRRDEALTEFRKVASLPLKLASDQRTQSRAARLVNELSGELSRY
jgi:tetratricopeptide (TPR) repeat protein